ncbi:MAG TPA: DUF4430 domain-containing protein [Methanomassiliicoccales archaeon]|jgi:hypothetical protein
MKKSTLVAIIVVVLVAVVLVSGMGLFPGNSSGAKNKTATMTIDFSDAPTNHFRNNVTTWTNSSGVWTYETHASGNGTTIFVFKNMTFSDNVMDLLMECAGKGDFAVVRQQYVAMGTIIERIDGVNTERPGRGWQFYVNDVYGTVACDKTTLNDGDRVYWKFMELSGNLT